MAKLRGTHFTIEDLHKAREDVKKEIKDFCNIPKEKSLLDYVIELQDKVKTLNKKDEQVKKAIDKCDTYNILKVDDGILKEELKQKLGLK